MRQTGKLWWLTVFSYILNISACVLIAGWTERTAEYHLWLDVALSGLGGSSVTTTVITVSQNSLFSLNIYNASADLALTSFQPEGYNIRCSQGGRSCSHGK
jgi:hypothetical protein